MPCEIEREKPDFLLRVRRTSVVALQKIRCYDAKGHVSSCERWCIEAPLGRLRMTIGHVSKLETCLFARLKLFWRIVEGMAKTQNIEYQPIVETQRESLICSHKHVRSEKTCSFIYRLLNKFGCLFQGKAKRTYYPCRIVSSMWYGFVMFFC